LLAKEMVFWDPFAAGPLDLRVLRAGGILFSFWVYEVVIIDVVCDFGCGWNVECFSMTMRCYIATRVEAKKRVACSRDVLLILGLELGLRFDSLSD